MTSSVTCIRVPRMKERHHFYMIYNVIAGKFSIVVILYNVKHLLQGALSIDWANNSVMTVLKPWQK